MSTQLTEAEIEQGWHDTFSTRNPFNPCDNRSFLKAVRWAEHKVVTETAAERIQLREQVSNLNRVIREGAEANRLLQANNDRLREALETANSQFEEFERRYYLESDKVESVRAVNAELVAALQRYVQHDIAADEAQCSALCTSNLHRTAVATLKKAGR